jgi:hypothetical protein
MEERMPPLQGYEMSDGASRIYTADYDFRDVAVADTRFYARIRGTGRLYDYCFTLAVPDPDARIVLELLEASAVEQPFVSSDRKWDDPKLDVPCVGDAWGCLAVNGAVVDRLPYEVRLGDLTERTDDARASLVGEGNNKSFCFRTAAFNKRAQKSAAGYVVEVMGVVERGAPGERGYRDLDETTRKNLEELGYIQ